MRVLMTTDCVGGVWTYAVELVRGLAEQGIDVLLVSSGAPLTEAQRKELSEVPGVRLVETRYKLEWMSEPWDDVQALGQRLLQFEAEFAPDVVHLNEYCYGALDWKTPTLVVGHSCVFSWFENVRGHAPGPEWSRYRDSVTRGLRSADLVVTPTRFMLDALERHYGPLDVGRVVSNGISLPKRNLISEAKQPFVFGAGRWWDEAKNVAALGRVAHRLLWPVRIAGLPSPEGGSGALPEGVESLGRLDSHRMRECYQRVAIYCLPARYEPFGLTPLEAAAHGCALVLGDTPSLREVWGDAALFVASDDDDAIANALLELIEHEEVRSRLAQRALQRARRFSREHMTQEYLGLYEGLMSKSSAVVAKTPVGEVV